MYYKLIDAIDSPKDLNVVSRKDSAVRYTRIRLYPGKKYEVPEDDTLLESLRNAKETIKWTQAREDALKRYKIPYELKRCKQCGGRVLKLEYNVVEVCDEEA